MQTDELLLEIRERLGTSRMHELALSPTEHDIIEGALQHGRIRGPPRACGVHGPGVGRTRAALGPRNAMTATGGIRIGSFLTRSCFACGMKGYSPKCRKAESPFFRSITHGAR